MVSQDCVQFDVASKLRIGHIKGRLHHFAARPGQTPIKSDMKNILKTKIDRVQRGHVGKSVEWPAELVLLIGEERQYLVHYRLIQDAVRPPDEKVDVFDIRNIRR